VFAEGALEWPAHAPCSALAKSKEAPGPEDDTPNELAEEAGIISGEAFDIEAKFSMGGPVGIDVDATSHPNRRGNSRVTRPCRSPLFFITLQ